MNSKKFQSEHSLNQKIAILMIALILMVFIIGCSKTMPQESKTGQSGAETKTEIDSCKVNSDVPTLWNALSGLYHKARISLGGSTLVLPLVGGNLAGIGLPTRDLLNLIILSIITETKRKQITTCVRIVLTVDLYDDINLRELKQHWR